MITSVNLVIRIIQAYSRYRIDYIVLKVFVTLPKLHEFFVKNFGLVQKYLHIEMYDRTDSIDVL